MASGEVIGLTSAKINGKYHVDVKNIRWDVKRANVQVITQGGPKQAVGIPVASGSIDQVIPKDKDLDWSKLRMFSIDILDQETRSIVIASFDECNWGDVSGSSDLQGANAGKAITWIANKPNKY